MVTLLKEEDDRGGEQPGTPHHPHQQDWGCPNSTVHATPLQGRARERPLS